jgi:hypothetical protein
MMATAASNLAASSVPRSTSFMAVSDRANASSDIIRFSMTRSPRGYMDIGRRSDRARGEM